MYPDGMAISPQTWGCTVAFEGSVLRFGNLPTDVGMYRGVSGARRFTFESPHRRGDVPHGGDNILAGHSISPQTWGCTDEA